MVSLPSPGQGFVVPKLTSTSVTALATSEAGVTAGLTSAPGGLITTPGAAAASIVAPPATVVSIAKVPVVPATPGFLIPSSMKETVPAKTEPPLRVRVTVWPETEIAYEPSGAKALRNVAPETSKPVGKVILNPPSPGKL